MSGAAATTMERALSQLNRWATALVVALLFVETILVFVAVVARYVVNFSLPWSDEVARALLTWIVFVGAGLSLGKRELVSLTYFRDLLPDAALRWVQFALMVVMAAFLAALFWYSLELMSLTARQVTPVLQMRLAWVYLAIPVGTTLMLLNLAREFNRVRTGAQPLREVH